MFININYIEYTTRAEILQDFGFDEACMKLKLTRDGNYCMATGTYKPQIRVYEFAESAMKFERHTDAENIDFEILSSDWTKSAHLQNDRSIEFHAQGGIHATTRIPKFGRALTYNPNTCDLIIAATGNQVYRLNVDQGRFMAPFEMDFTPVSSNVDEEGGVNCLDINPVHALLGFGLENGTVEFWDPRSRKRVSQLNIGGAGYGMGSGVTALSFRNDGLNVGFGTYEGKTLLFDLRASEPYVQKDQGYDFPIKKIGWIETEAGGSSTKVFTADRKILKIWDRVDGRPFTSVEPVVDINDVAYIKDSGMFLLANEGRDNHAYYIPAIGAAPKWCSHIENITEEMEQNSKASVYENVRFIPKDALKSLNLEQYVGTNVIKSYMHGYIMSEKLYKEINAIVNPNEYERYRQKEVEKRIEKERETRIRTSGAVAPKVKANKALAEKLLRESEINGVDNDGDDQASSLVSDNRFKSLFEDPDFEVDEKSSEYRAKTKKKNDTNNTVRLGGEERERMRGLTAAEDEDIDEARFNKSNSNGPRGRFESDDEIMEDSDESSDEEDRRARKAKELKKKKEKKSQPEDEFPEMRALDAYEEATEKRRNHAGFADDIDEIQDEEDIVFEDLYDNLNQEEKERQKLKASMHHTRSGEATLVYYPTKKSNDKNSKKNGSKHNSNNNDDDDDENNGDENNRGRTKQRYEGRRKAIKKSYR